MIIKVNITTQIFVRDFWFHSKNGCYDNSDICKRFLVPKGNTSYKKHLLWQDIQNFFVCKATTVTMTTLYTDFPTKLKKHAFSSTIKTELNHLLN